MISIEVFMRNNGIKNRKTVEGWIVKGLIPGANTQTLEVPDAARAPYTKARAKSASGIYWSILKAAKGRKHVVPQLYNLSQTEFDYYIRQLADGGYITVRVEDGILYYDCTIEGANCTKKMLLEFYSKTVSAFAEGVARVASLT